MVDDPDIVLQPTNEHFDVADVHDDQPIDADSNVNYVFNSAVPDVGLDDWRLDPSHPDAQKTHFLPEPNLPCSDHKRRVLPLRFANDYGLRDVKSLTSC